MQTGWRCHEHGHVMPYRLQPASEAVAVDLARRADVPVWAPAPLPTGWTVTGFGHAGEEKSGPRATVVACAGPSPVGGPVDLLLVAEEPGVGLGTRYCGVADHDVEGAIRQPPARRITVGGHQCPLWSIACAPDRVAFVGEAGGVWLWLVMWPSDADLVLADGLGLADLRDGGAEHLLFGAAGPYLATG